jgi:hypothetical protein
MNYDFYADKNDAADVLNFIFSETDLILYQLDSVFGKEINHYKSTDQVMSAFNFTSWKEPSPSFQLWSPRFEGDLVIRKVDLDPKYCKGHTFRYSTEGWGLIQLYFGVQSNDKIQFSHLGHQSEKRALAWEDTCKNLGPVQKWNWTEVESAARKIKNHIHGKLAVRKEKGYGILKGADSLVK